MNGTSNQTQVYEYLKAHPNAPVLAAAISEDLSLGRDRVDTALSKLVHGGSSDIKRVGPALYMYERPPEAPDTPGGEVPDITGIPAQEEEQYFRVGQTRSGRVIIRDASGILHRVAELELK